MNNDGMKPGGAFGPIDYTQYKKNEIVRAASEMIGMYEDRAASAYERGRDRHDAIAWIALIQGFFLGIVVTCAVQGWWPL